MQKRHTIIATVLLLLFLWHCRINNQKENNDYWSWKKNIPAEIPAAPGSDTITIPENKIELGRYLFYDTRLSVNNTRSCGTCHNPSFSFTDTYRKSTGAYGDEHLRNSATLINLLYTQYFTSSDSAIHQPEVQMKGPLMNQHPVEMGFGLKEESIIKFLTADHFYNRKFDEVYPGKKITASLIKESIAAFIKTIVSYQSAYDRYKYFKDSTALNEMQKKGMALFFSAQLKCSHCHGGFNFSTPADDSVPYFNIGLYNVNNKDLYPANDPGLQLTTGKITDNGKFRIRTLRNLAFTAPYFHDGSAATLGEVVDVYINGGRNIPFSENKGDGRINSNKDKRIAGFSLTADEKKQLIEFLLSLSDSSVNRNPSFQNPFASSK